MSEPLLSVGGLVAGYGRVGVLRDIELTVGSGEIVALLGANGAGKSTLLKAIAGLLAPSGGTVTYAGHDVTGRRAERLVQEGLALVPEGRLLFAEMTVADNLELGGYTISRGSRSRVFAERLSRVHELFPVLSERSEQVAATLSGGEQQMLAVGRALMSGPTLLLLDEPSLGLAPKVIAEIFAVLDALRESGVSVLLAEQDARLALRHADRGYVMRTGEVVLSGTSDTLLADDSIRRIYLGMQHAEGEVRP
jgi:branched-chain amino acid transport system ATP-binding protein